MGRSGGEGGVEHEQLQQSVKGSLCEEVIFKLELKAWEFYLGDYLGHRA